MALAVVFKPNPYFPTGTWLEGTDEGWQKAIVEQKANRLRVIRTEGILLEKKTMQPFILRPMKRGLDK